jgi:hypothetical protein
VQHLSSLTVLGKPSTDGTITLLPDDCGSDFAGMLVDVSKREFLPVVGARVRQR